MEARNIKVYKNLDTKSKDKNNRRFYSFYNDAIEKLEMSKFLDFSVDVETENIEMANPKIYGIINGNITNEYEVVLTFQNMRNKKNYIVYTDNQKDLNGNYIIYSAVYDMENPDPFESFLKKQEEWLEVCSVMDAIFLYN